MKLAIKVDVDTFRGTKEGVPALCKLLRKHDVPATFLFSLGPDNTGKALSRIFRKGFLKKCLRSNVAGNYGLKTLMYGTILKAPMIAKHCAEQMRKTLHSGFECGIHCWDHYKWQDYLAKMSRIEVLEEFSKARNEFEKVFGFSAQCCGSAGWQITPDALAVEDSANLLYTSDTRGSEPFIPTMSGQQFKTLQIPSTLLTLDEVLGLTPLESVANMHFLEMRKQSNSVMTIHAELEGMAYLEWFDSFLAKAKSENVEFFALSDYAKSLLASPEKIRRNEIVMSEFTGRSGKLAVQR